MESNVMAEGEKFYWERTWNSVFPEIQWRKVFVLGTQSGSEVDRRALLFHSWGIDAKREW